MNFICRITGFAEDIEPLAGKNNLFVEKLQLLDFIHQMTGSHQMKEE